MDRQMGKIIELEALRLTSDGSGIGYDQGLATFVQGLLPGETGKVEIIECKKNWQRAKLLDVVSSSGSSTRVTPPCSVFESCGGCQLQHMPYEETLAWKKQWVEDALRRIGKISARVNPTLGMAHPWRYRNKARLHRDAAGGFGYYQEKSNSAIRFNDCLLLTESMNGWIRETAPGLSALSPEVKTVTWRENSQGEGLCLIEQGALKVLETDSQNETMAMESKDPKPSYLPEEIKSFWGVNQDGELEHYWGSETLGEEILGLKFKVSALAFLQINHSQTEILYSQALKYAGLSGAERLWDLYAGIGTLTLALARQAKEVCGVEENLYAVQDAWQNAELNDIKNVKFIEGKVEERLAELGDSPGVVVLDPPRAGAHRLVIDRIIAAKPKRIVYVSCDPGTLARDAGLLAQAGYEVVEVQPVDMFPWTMHVETVVLIERR